MHLATLSCWLLQEQKHIRDMVEKWIYAVNDTLHSHNIEEYLEPQHIRTPSTETRMQFSNGWFQDLQELMACVLLGHDWQYYVNSKIHNQNADEFLDLVMESEIGMASHLICHGAEGLFVPKPSEFENPLYSSMENVPGGWIGSTEKLMEELLQLCPVLQLELRPLRGVIRRGGGMDISTETSTKIKECTTRLFGEGKINDESESVLYDRVCYMWYVLFTFARMSASFESALILAEDLSL